MLSAVSKAAVYAENVSVKADNLSVTEDSVTADLIYNTDTADGYVMAAVYDENQRFKSFKIKKVDSENTLSIDMSPADTVQTFIWQDFTKPYWSQYNTVLNPQETDFDGNGYAYLWLTFTHSGFYEKEVDNKITPKHDIYLDDISITERTELTETTAPTETNE